MSASPRASTRSTADHSPPHTDGAATDAALSELRILGAALGGLHWVQGPGGNVSVKAGHDELWVKASGRRLADVAATGGYARVPMALAQQALAGDGDADRQLFAATPRPSLETYFHILGPRIVAHTHSLGSMWVGCSHSCVLPLLAPPYQQVPMAVVPYVPPGRGLALAIASAMPDAGECIVLLRSHGLVVFAQTATRAVELSRAFDEAVGWQRQVVGAPSVDDLLSNYRSAPIVALREGCLTRGLPPRRYPPPVLAGQVLFPDAAVYASVQPVRDASLRLAADRSESRRPLTLVDGTGHRLLVARDAAALENATELAATHDWLVDQLLPRGEAHFLSADDAAHIVGMPSEQYRMSLAALPTGGA